MPLYLILNQGDKALQKRKLKRRWTFRRQNIKRVKKYTVEKSFSTSQGATHICFMSSGTPNSKKAFFSLPVYIGL